MAGTRRSPNEAAFRHWRKALTPSYDNKTSAIFADAFFGTATRNLAVPFVASATTVYAPTISGSGSASSTTPFISATTTVYSPSVIGSGSVTRTVPFVASSTSVYAPTLQFHLTATLPFVSSGTVVYTPTVRRSSLVVPFVPASTSCFAPTIAFAGPPPPVNDDFLEAIAIAGAAGTRAGGDVTSATVQTSEPTGTAITGGLFHTTWFAWTPSTAGTATFDTSGSMNTDTSTPLDTTLAVWTGPHLPDLTEVASNDNNGSLLTSKVTFAAVVGTVYYIQVGTKTVGDHGTVNLNWSTATVSSAFTITGSAPFVSLTAGDSASFTITSSGPGTSILTLGISGAPAGVTATFSSPTIPENGGTSTVTISTTELVPPATYSFTVTATNGLQYTAVAAVTVVLAVTGGTNISCASATRLAGSPGTVVFDNRSVDGTAWTSSDPLFAITGGTGGAPLWYKWTNDGSASVLLRIHFEAPVSSAISSYAACLLLGTCGDFDTDPTSYVTTNGFHIQGASPGAGVIDAVVAAGETVYLEIDGWTGGDVIPPESGLVPRGEISVRWETLAATVVVSGDSGVSFNGLVGTTSVASGAAASGATLTIPITTMVPPATSATGHSQVGFVVVVSDADTSGGPVDTRHVTITDDVAVPTGAEYAVRNPPFLALHGWPVGNAYLTATDPPVFYIDTALSSSDAGDHVIYMNVFPVDLTWGYQVGDSVTITFNYPTNIRQASILSFQGGASAITGRNTTGVSGASADTVTPNLDIQDPLHYIANDESLGSSADTNYLAAPFYTADPLTELVTLALFHGEGDILDRSSLTTVLDPSQIVASTDTITDNLGLWTSLLNRGAGEVAPGQGETVWAIFRKAIPTTPTIFRYAQFLISRFWKPLYYADDPFASDGVPNFPPKSILSTFGVIPGDFPGYTTPIVIVPAPTPPPEIPPVGLSAPNIVFLVETDLKS